MNELLSIENLIIHYETDDATVEAVNGVSLVVSKGTTLGIVGETGAGKTTLAKGIMKLTPKPQGKIKQGKIMYSGQNLLDMNDEEIRAIRGKHISMIFQDPMTSLNPVLTVGMQIAEVIENHEGVSRAQAEEKAKEMLEFVGIPATRSEEYPHQFSGGMKQRVIIAIALACNPELLIADEPTTALDVTIQAQVLEMMRELKEKLSTSMILITHDLGIVAQNCDNVAIMYAGEILEYGTVREVFKTPLHPYTNGLFGSIPSLNEDVDRLKPIDGLMPDPAALPRGCVFAQRCPHAREDCIEKKPELRAIDGTHAVRCHMISEDR